MKSTNELIWTLAGACAIALTSIANAQSEAAAIEEVVVTGSRVITNGDASPTPVTVVTVEDVLRTVPTTISEALNTLPTFSGSRGALSNPNSGAASQTGGGNSAGSFLNLRNMGAVRSLILYDGLRVPPTNVSGIVDTDMIPQMLLQRVEVVTGGASAVYGSDAVTGVVNFITDRSFNGIKAQVQHGQNERGDDQSYGAGLAAGMDLFGGRGHIEGSYEYRDSKGVSARSDRDPDHKVWSVQGLGTAAVPYYLTPYARVNNQTFGGLITSGALNGRTFNTNGVATPMTRGAASGTNGIDIGGDGVYFDTTMKAPARSHQLFVRFDYDLSDTTHGYLEYAGNDKLNDVYTTWSLLNNVALSRTNAYLDPAYTALIPVAQPSFTFRKSMQDVTRNETAATERQSFVNGGLEGEFTNGYKWNLGVVHSTAKLTQTSSNLHNGRLFAALDAVQVTAANVGATGLAIGSIACNVALTNPGLYPGCRPLNPFGPTSDDPAVVDYYRGKSSLIANTQMNDLTAAIRGELFSTWAGPVNAALSAEWRKLSYRGDSDALPSDRLTCTGLRFNPCTAATTTWNNTIAARSKVEQTVKEAAFEADIPLLADKRLAKSMNLNGAVRYTDYSTSGEYTTWKVGLDWHLNDSLRMRATRSRDIRAPTLDDLYAPTTITPGGNFNDLLIGATATNVTAISGGNDGLTAEQGDTWTAGVVFKPTALPGFSAAVDYFNIAVSNAILQLLPINPTYQRTCNDSLGSSPYCQLYVRPFPYTNATPANAVTTTYQRQINIAEQESKGVDIEFNYAPQWFGRPASLRLLSTFQPEILYKQPGIVTLDQGGAAFGTNAVTAAPEWRHTLFLRFSPFENFSVTTQSRYRNSLRQSGDPTHVISTGKIPAANFTNVNLAYQVQNDWWENGEIFLTIANAFDQSAPPASFYGGQGVPGSQATFVVYDDPLGRAFTVGARVRF